MFAEQQTFAEQQMLVEQQMFAEQRQGGASSATDEAQLLALADHKFGLENLQWFDLISFYPSNR